MAWLIRAAGTAESYLEVAEGLRFNVSMIRSCQHPFKSNQKKSADKKENTWPETWRAVASRLTSKMSHVHSTITLKSQVARSSLEIMNART
jgi:hypothetical protein